MVRSVLVGCALLPFVFVIGCGGDDGGTNPGDGEPGPVTEESITTFFEQQAPLVRSGALDGFVRLAAATQGGGQDGVTITPKGGNSFDVTIAMDLDGAGALRDARETSLLLTAGFAGDPLDGLDAEDFPCNVQVTGVSTPFGTYSASATAYALGGGQTVTIFYLEGTSELHSGSRVESSEVGYTADITFPGLPITGWEYVEVTGGSGTAEYDVCYRTNTVGGQYVLVWGTVGGADFSLELGGPPAPGGLPCKE